MFGSLHKPGGGLHVLLVCPNRSVNADLTGLLSQRLPSAGVQDQLVYPTRSTLAEWLSTKPGVCFMEVNSDPEKAISLIAEMVVMEPSLLVVAVLASNDPELILRCLRQGAAEFLTAPFTEDQFTHVLERISRLQPRALQPGADSARVYCVMPAKGSCGASAIALNLAFQQKRGGSKRVLLADLDPITGIVSFLSKTPSKYSFLDVLARAYELDADIWKGIISNWQGIDMLLSPDNPIDAQMDLHDAEGIVTFSRQLYDTVVLDTRGVYGEWNLSLVRACDCILLVTTNEISAVRAAQRVLAYLERNRFDQGRIRLIVNRFSDDGLSLKVIETALSVEICHTLPDDTDAVRKALVEGKQVGPGSAFSKSIKELAEKLSGRTEEEPAKKQSSFGGLLSIFSRPS